jgi:hypothetical protein
MESSPQSVFMFFYDSYCTVGEEAIVGEMSNWGLPHYAGSNRNIRRFTAHKTGLRKVKFQPIIRGKV